ncbi:outer membrane beta-barrel protein [Hymenobacter volaticus]|uniref:Porin family protein n=1 Tax=Hymenobacter volaticus TaxID=2932254 RepID=A0ABY4G722_9BACT|nr:outer membrane beta-barrel protein [Hymenobacter volaticus]UOQ66575.1 porin family protein [Hymenobacter volaticus]
MKKLLLLSIACAISASAMAQTEKGAKYIGVNIGGVNYQNNKNGSSIGAALLPSAGVFVADNLLVGTGIQLSYLRNNSKPKGATEDNISRHIQYGLSPSVRYYFAGTNPHRFFGQLSGGIAWSNQYQKYQVNSETISSSTTSHYATASAALGYNYFLTPGAALEVTAGYTRNGIGESDFNYGQVVVSAGFAIFLPSKLSTTSTGQ